MPVPDKQLMLVPSGHDPEKLEEYRRRIDSFRERQAAARLRTAEAQRKFRFFFLAVIAALVLIAGLSAYVAYSLRQVKGSLVSQLESAQSALAVSNERWKDARQALADNRSALQASEQLLAQFRAETRASLLLPNVDRVAGELLDSAQAEVDPAEERAVIFKLREIVQPEIVRAIAAAPNTPDSQIVSQIERIVRARMAGVLKQSRRH